VGRQLASIVVLGVLALAAFSAMAIYGSSKNPRMRVKSTVERAAPVIVESCRIADTMGGARRELQMTITSRDGAPLPRAALLAAAFATIARPRPGEGETVPDFSWLVLDERDGGPEGPTRTALSIDRFNLDRWRDLEPRTGDLAAALAKTLGEGTTLTIAPNAGELVIEVRPGRAGIAPRDAARAVAGVTRAYRRFIVIGPGAAPVEVSLEDALK
jgi:hypothetical protein